MFLHFCFVDTGSQTIPPSDSHSGVLAHAHRVSVEIMYFRSISTKTNFKSVVTSFKILERMRRIKMYLLEIHVNIQFDRPQCMPKKEDRTAFSVPLNLRFPVLAPPPSHPDSRFLLPDRPVLSPNLSCSLSHETTILAGRQFSSLRGGCVETASSCKYGTPIQDADSGNILRRTCASK